MNAKIYLGRLAWKYPGERIWISKHSWDCGWYWSCGYLGNKNLHFHIESLISQSWGSPQPPPYEASKIFKDTWITDNDWWVIRDLFIQAYALKKAAEVYWYGGHQTSRPGVTDVIKNLDRAAEINKTLELLLDTTWDFMTRAYHAAHPALEQ